MLVCVPIVLLIIYLVHLIFNMNSHILYNDFFVTTFVRNFVLQTTLPPEGRQSPHSIPQCPLQRKKQLYVSLQYFPACDLLILNVSFDLISVGPGDLRTFANSGNSRLTVVSL